MEVRLQPRWSEFSKVELHAKPRCEFASPTERNVLFAHLLVQNASAWEVNATVL